MNNTIWQKKIPTLFGLLLILGGLAITSLLVKTGVIFQGRAAPSEEPRNIRITNVSANSFTVSYITDDKTAGSLSYGTTTALGTAVLDDRDKTTKALSPYHIHYITVNNVKPSTKYYFDIISGGTQYRKDGKPFEVTTAQPLQNTSNSTSVKGNVVLLSGTDVADSVVYITTSGSQTLSTLIQNNGSYSFSLNSLRNLALSSYFNYTPDTVFQLLFVRQDSQSHVLASGSKLDPLPTVIFSKDYDFTNNPASAPSFSDADFPFFSTTSPNPPTGPGITIPKKDQGFIDQWPQFSGTAVPQQTVDITSLADGINASVQADKNGNWRFRTPKALTPGQHTITIRSKNASGVVTTVTQTFTVFPLGSQVVESATPSATPILSPTAIPTPTVSPTAIPTGSTTPTPKLTVTPTATPTVMPTPVPTNTPNPTLAPSATPVPTRIAVQPTLPPTGNSSTITIGFAAIATTIIGVLLLLIL